MVQIGDMRMVVRQRRVAMGMRMRLGDRLRMDVPVMLVVDVQVVVLKFLMGMHMRMALAHQEHYPRRHQQAARPLGYSRRVAEHNHGNDRPDKRRGRKKSGFPGGAKDSERPHIEHQACSVA